MGASERHQEQNLAARGVAKANGETAFVLGNGPSLGMIDLGRLSGCATIGLNAAYRHWRQIGWRPRYYACLDLVVGMSHKDAIAELIEEAKIDRFLLRGNLVEALGEKAQNPRVFNFDVMRPATPFFAVDPITTGSHAALWAASMGYDQVVLLGVDAQYKEVVEGAERRAGIELEIVNAGANPNYYFEGYQAEGDRFNLPNPRPDLHVNAWRRAARVLKTAGVAAYNGNEASGVRCFPYVSFDAFMGAGDSPRPAGEDLSGPEDETFEPPLSRPERLRAFLNAYGKKGLFASGLAAAALCVWIYAFAPSLALAVFAAGAVFAALGAIAAFLYSRHAMLHHLHRQSEEMAALRARLAIMERAHLRAPRGKA